MISGRPRGRPPKGTWILPWDHSAVCELWEKALESEHGIAIPSTRPHSLVARLHKARHEAVHRRYDHLAVKVINGEVWITLRR